MFKAKISAGTRLGSMLLDHVVMTFVFMLFILPFLIVDLSRELIITHEPPVPEEGLVEKFKYVAIIGLALYLCKDCIGGRSVAKRILKLQVVKNSTGMPTSALRCFVRDIFCLLWPVEAFVALANPERRIGDFVAGTRLVVFEPSIEQPKVNYPQVALSLVLSYGCMVILMLFMYGNGPKISKKNIQIIKTSFNINESNDLIKLYDDSLGQYLKADVRVSDKVKFNNKKYVSVILYLTHNYLNDSYSFSQFKTKSLSLLYTRFPDTTFIGKMQFVYKAPGELQTSSIYFN